MNPNYNEEQQINPLEKYGRDITKAVTDGGVTRGWYFVPVRKIPKWLESLSKLGEIPSGQTLSALALYMAKKFRI